MQLLFSAGPPKTSSTINLLFIFLETPVKLLLLTDQQLLAQCSVDLYRVQGPGGQKRNKTSSAVRLRHQSSGLVVTASEERSQNVNKQRAIKRLREAIALHVRTALDAAYEPSELLRSCIALDGRFHISRKNDEYFLVLSEVLDVLDAANIRVSDAAKLLGISTAQLVGFIENDPKVWDRVNQMRTAAGEKPLR